MSQKLQLSASHKAGYGFTKSANERRSSPMLIRGNHRPQVSTLLAFLGQFYNLTFKLAKSGLKTQVRGVWTV